MPFQTLPYWLQISVFFLALNAGMINVLCLTNALHQAVTHTTGNVSMFAISLVQWQPQTLLFLLLIIICYIIGAFYSGFILGNNAVQMNKLYGLPLTLVTVCLFLCWFFMAYWQHYALLWAAVAMGIQNAMISHYKGTIIRTTHLTGVMTDLGLALGYFLRGLEVPPRRVILHLLIIFGFLSGGLIGASVTNLLKLNAFLLPVFLSGALSLIYWILYLRYLNSSKGW